MIGALWTGISGLASHQKALDNESHNIANVNTVGYKAGRVSFADQVYQNKIGKGSFVQDAEKIFETGSFKQTGVTYDTALLGDGFFKVTNKNTLGTAETFYTRAGNFRMGENGTLQTAGEDEVQGWVMNAIDPKNDVKSTNHNITRFTADYIKNVGNAVIRHKDYIETIAGKVTNFNETVKSDAVAVFSGAGQKTQSSKLKDISLAQESYDRWLQRYQEEPNAISKNSTNQISQINFKTGLPPVSLIGKEGDQIEVTINGTVYNQPFVLAKTTVDYRQKIWDGLTGSERALHGLQEPTSILALSDIDQQVAIAAYDKVAGKIETYKALADKISNSGAGGLNAYLAVNTSNPRADVLYLDGTYEQSTKIADMLQGVIQIEGIIPGKEFRITSVSEILGGSKTTVKGTFQSTALATEGSGKAALENARDVLARLVSGNQQSVYTTQDLYGSAGIPTLDRSYTFSIDIFDKDLGRIIPVPNDGNTPPQVVPITIPAGATIDEIAHTINNVTTTTGNQLGDYIVAKNINGYLVLETTKSNYDLEFEPKLNILPTVNLNSLVDNAEYSYSIKVNGQTISISPIEVGNTLDATKKQEIYDQIKTAVNVYNSQNPNHTIQVSNLTNGTFTLTSNDNLEATLELTTSGPVMNPTTTNHVLGTATVFPKKTVTIPNPIPNPSTNPTTYSVTIGTTPYTVTTDATNFDTTDKVVAEIMSQIQNDSTNTALQHVNVTRNGNEIVIEQISSSSSATPTEIIINGSPAPVVDNAFVAGTPSSIELNFDLDDQNKSRFMLDMLGIAYIY